MGDMNNQESREKQARGDGNVNLEETVENKVGREEKKWKKRREILRTIEQKRAKVIRHVLRDNQYLSNIFEGKL
ncbi:hypothetical protein J437_LFUL000613 [Ladona fulva]|uniref:Uncharacterized protein n=1 Tax=Ladona fulva TaxID=123851 RepID=A0A8K0K8I0_LADFU|nr:hypothetical protein J437_LFUL000613 [Ladona fulva]